MALGQLSLVSVVGGLNYVDPMEEGIKIPSTVLGEEIVLHSIIMGP